MEFSDTLIKSLNQRLSEKKVSGTPKIATYDQLKAIGKKEEKNVSGLIEKLNQRLSEEELTLDTEPTIIDPNKKDTEKTKDTYEDPFKIDWAPLLKSLKKEFGEDGFVKPDKEGDELLCVYFDVENYEVNSEKFNLENLQDWCLDKGFVVVSRMPSEDYIKVYFTQLRVMDDYKEDNKDEKGRKGEEFTKANFGMDYGKKTGIEPGKQKQVY